MDRIDLNADMGESFGIYTLGDDQALLHFVTSASIACGFHAGDPGTMARAVESCLARGVAFGAHPGLPDLAGFGRRAMAVTPAEVRDLITYQVGALAAFAARHGRRLQHVKPHGALYAMAERDPAVAKAIAQAVCEVDADLILMGLSEGKLVAAGREQGLRVANEVFADRSYEPDGTLTPRGRPGAVLDNPEKVAARIVRLAREGKIAAVDGSDLTLAADTICLHGDALGAALLADAVLRALEAQGVAVRPLGAP